MKKPPQHIIQYINDPETWDSAAFEVLIKAELETTIGPVTSSDELLVGLLTMSVDTLLMAHRRILQSGYTAQYNGGQGEGVSPWYKIRNESLDKVVKVLAELSLVARGRPKKTNKVSEIDELFASA